MYCVTSTEFGIFKCEERYHIQQCVNIIFHEIEFLMIFLLSITPVLKYSGDTLALLLLMLHIGRDLIS